MCLLNPVLYTQCFPPRISRAPRFHIHACTSTSIPNATFPTYRMSTLSPRCFHVSMCFPNLTFLVTTLHMHPSTSTPQRSVFPTRTPQCLQARRCAKCRQAATSGSCSRAVLFISFPHLILQCPPCVQVCKVPEGCSIQLLDAAGQPASTSGDGSDVQVGMLSI